MNEVPENAQKCKERVLARLRAGAMLDQWVRGSELCRPDVGGLDGTRRVRDLRKDGYVILNHRMTHRGIDGRRTNEHEYRIFE
jgi:hypothetical protein